MAETGEAAVVSSGSDVAFASYASEVVPPLLGGSAQELLPVLKTFEDEITA